jgi:hypothetical protein
MDFQKRPFLPDLTTGLVLVVLVNFTVAETPSAFWGWIVGRGTAGLSRVYVAGVYDLLSILIEFG